MLGIELLELTSLVGNFNMDGIGELLEKTGLDWEELVEELTVVKNEREVDVMTEHELVTTAAVEEQDNGTEIVLEELLEDELWGKLKLVLGKKLKIVFPERNGWLFFFTLTFLVLTSFNFF